MQAHPAAAVFPMLGESELAELAADIREHGQREPIVVHEGMILDGRNRWAACQLAGVEPVVKPWDGEGGSPLTFVVSMNLKRRHLTESQRAAVAADLLPLIEAETRERVAQARREQAREGGQFTARSPCPVNSPSTVNESRQVAANALKVGATQVSDAKRIKRDAPDLFERVKAGEMTVYKAKRETKKRQPQTTPRAGKNGGKQGATQERPERRGPVMAYSVEWARVRQFAREKWFPLPPDTVAATLAGDEVAAARGFIVQCTAWLDAFSTAIEQGHTERVTA